MALKSFALAAAISLCALPVLAGEMKIMIKDAYARSGAKSGAAFMTLVNQSDRDDRLIGVRSTLAKRVELHSHTEDANGVMRMREIEGGIALPAGGMHMLARGGDHVMFMGLDAPLPEGEEIRVTLTFEHAGDVPLMIPVDNDRKAASHGHRQGHGLRSAAEGAPKTGKENR